MIKVNEAVLVNRDYKYDSDKGEILISKKNFKKVPKDFKNDTPGKERMITYDSKWGTVSVPVKFTEEVKKEEVEIKEALNPLGGKPFEDLKGVADVALKIMTGQPQEVKEEEKEDVKEENPQELTE